MKTIQLTTGNVWTDLVPQNPKAGDIHILEDEAADLLCSIGVAVELKVEQPVKKKEPTSASRPAKASKTETSSESEEKDK